MTITRRPVEIQWEGITIPMGDVEADDADTEEADADNLHYACAASRRARLVVPTKIPVDENGRRESPRPLWTEAEREVIVTQAIVQAQGRGIRGSDVRHALRSAVEMQGELRVMREALATIRSVSESPEHLAPAMGIVHLIAEAAAAGLVVGFVDGKLVRGEPPRDWFRGPTPMESTLRLVGA